MFKVGNKNTSVFEHFTSCSSVSIVNFQQVNVYWVIVHCLCNGIADDLDAEYSMVGGNTLVRDIVYS